MTDGSEGDAAAVRGLLRRELLLGLRHGSDTAGPLLFFTVAVTLFPLAVGPSPDLLARIAPGVIWVSATLAALLPLDRMFAGDAEDGTLDVLLVSGLSGATVALAKAATHWITTGLPLLVVSLPISAILGLDRGEVLLLVAGLVPGTMILSLLGTAGAAIVLGARRGGLLLPLLVLPLSMPSLIFGVGATEPGSARPNLLLLSAYLSAALPLCPLAAGAGLRAATDL